MVDGGNEEAQSKKDALASLAAHLELKTCLYVKVLTMEVVETDIGPMSPV